MHISSSSQSSIAAQQKIVLADRSLCSRQQRGGGEGGGQSVSPCSPSALTQIVPISASIYTVFHSVIFNSVVERDILKFAQEYCVVSGAL